MVLGVRSLGKRRPAAVPTFIGVEDPLMLTIRTSDAGDAKEGTIDGDGFALVDATHACLGASPSSQLRELVGDAYNRRVFGDPMSDDRQWPRRCACGRAYTRDEWGRLKDVGSSPDGVGGQLELRVCTCGSTISVELGGPRGDVDSRGPRTVQNAESPPPPKR
jgi:hypothetical protein